MVASFDQRKTPKHQNNIQYKTIEISEEVGTVVRELPLLHIDNILPAILNRSCLTCIPGRFILYYFNEIR